MFISIVNKAIPCPKRETLLCRCSFDFSLHDLSVFVESAFHTLDGAVCANPKLLANHPDESFVVRDENDAAGVLVDGFAERFNGFDVQVIRRFVENEEVGRS